MIKLSNGAISGAQSELTDSFNTSLPFDCRMYREDILGSIAHATMLGDTAIIDKAEAEKIISALNEILFDIESGKLGFSAGGEDIHMFVEAELTSRIGDTGKKLHTARSRNDQVALDARLYCRSEIIEIQSLLKTVIESLIAHAKNNLKTYMPGFTHLQKAQPITVAHYFMAYVEMLLRDLDRLSDTSKRTNISPLGSGALAGTTHNIDRVQVAKLLAMDGVTNNSLDGVSDRDYMLELIFDISLIMTHLSRFCEELIIYASDDYKYFSIDNKYSTGSSIMPQKRNPDVAELIRGKSGRAIGNLVSLLTTLKGLPLAYNKDMQEDKESLFDSVDTVKACLTIFAPMVSSLTFNTEKLHSAAGSGFTNATDCADYLVKKGMPFRSAYAVSGNLVKYCVEKGINYLSELSLVTFKTFSELFENDVYEAINLETVVNRRNCIGACSETAVMASIKIAEMKLSKLF